MKNSNGVVPDIQYYVAPSFYNRYARNRYELYEVEKTVTQHYGNILYQGCEREKYGKSQEIQNIKKSKNSHEKKIELLEKLEKEYQTPSCKEYNDKFNYWWKLF